MEQNWVIWIVFGLLIALLVGFLLFSYLNDKRKNRRLAQKRIELKRATVKTSKELAIRIYTLIQFNQKLVDEVKPGHSNLKMKDVNFFARQFLKKIYDSKAFKTIYVEPEDADQTYGQNMKTLIDRKSNLWQKYCPAEISYFEKLHNELLEDEKFSLIQMEAQQDIEKFFKEIINQDEPAQ